MATHDKEISYWLEVDNREFLAIYGMGGSGKTTLAKYIYNSKKRYFEYVSFLEDIDRICKEPNGLLKLQEQLLKDLSGGKRRKIPSVSHGTCKIRDVLQMNRALLVLDDIVEHKQLVDLLGSEEINAKSKIIITTRDNTDNWFDSSCWSCRRYEMKLLNNDESSELLCHHAFRSKIPKAGYEELVLEAIQCCESNPLALEVLGSSLSKCNTILSWKSQLKLFLNDLHSGIEGVLEKSYKSLPYQSERELFLHIACFFVGMDIDYVVKILEPDYSALSGIKTLISKCLLSVSPNKKLMMHRLIQEMGKNIVRQESLKFPADRSRVWLSRDSFNILRKGRGSKTIEGLALDMNILLKEDFAYRSLELTTDALNYMENLKLLQLNFVKPDGFYDKFSEDLRWLCWHGFHLTTIPSDLFMGNLVALDMSYSNLVVFEPPKGLRSLQILNLKDSHELTEICKLYMIPNLETLILWNCYCLVNVCEKLGELTSLATLNMTGCRNLFNKEQTNTSLEAVTENLTFSFPRSLHRLFLGGCHLERTRIFPLSFSGQPYLQYLNLVNGQFESLHCFDHLKHLRVLDLSFCSELKFLLSLPSTLAELYVYHCESLERIAFESHQFTLQEIGYEGCVNLYEVEGFIKLVPIHKLDEADLGHLKWLKEYRNHEMRLVGDELIVGRSVRVQMLYEFGIASTFLPDIKDPNMTPKYKSESNFLSFDVPSCPKNKRLKGINVTFKYSSLDEDWGWFCKINTTNGIDLMYNPKVYGKPEVGEACIWLSYWPIGNTLKTGDRVHVTIVNVSMFKAEECGASLVYSDEETLALETNMGWEEVVGGELSAFQLSTGAYYLCRRDLFEYLEVRSSPFETWESAAQNRDWFRILVGDNIDHTEIRGWRKTGRPKHVNRSSTELKTVRYIMDDPQLEDIYDVANMSKPRYLNKPLRSTFAIVDEVAEAIQSNTFTDGDLLVKKKSEDTFSVKSKSGDTPYPQGENRIVSRENPLQVRIELETSSKVRSSSSILNTI